MAWLGLVWLGLAWLGFEEMVVAVVVVRRHPVPYYKYRYHIVQEHVLVIKAPILAEAGLSVQSHNRSNC